jgi:hypothetical protein
MSQLPVLKDAQWKLSKRGKRERFSVSLVHWEAAARENVINPFFWRDVTGEIFYPDCGLGWYWEPEVRAALAAQKEGMWKGDITVRQTWNCFPASDERPFAFVERVYAARRKLKAEGHGAEKILKLGLNSLYGKTAQRKGMMLHGQRHGGPFFQLEWAGYTTSYVRALLFMVAIQYPDLIISTATDAIYSMVELGLETSDQLGGWTLEEFDHGLFVQSGVYWLWKDKELIQTKYRGFDENSLSAEAVLKCWRKGQMTYEASATRFVAMGSVVSNPNLREHFRRWRTTPRVMDLSPGNKRQWEGSAPRTQPRLTWPNDEFTSRHGQMLSVMYPVPWITENPAGMIDGVDADIVDQEYEQVLE